MSHLATRNTLLTYAQTLLGEIPIAYENYDFDPSGLNEYVAFYYMPATSESTGKTAKSSDDERGFIQLSVFINADAPTYDNRQLEIIDIIKQGFYNTLNIDGVIIEEVQANQGAKSDSWFKRDLTINFSTFFKRV